MADPDELFPIMLPCYRSEIHHFLDRMRLAGVPFLVAGIPWTLIQPHEAQAQTNHGQTLRRLAERGGLSAGEAVAVLTGKRWGEIESDPVAAYRTLANAVNAYSPERERQVKDLIKAAQAMLGLFGKPRPEEYVDGGASYRLAIETVKMFIAALAPFSGER